MGVVRVVVVVEPRASKPARPTSGAFCECFPPSSSPRLTSHTLPCRVLDGTLDEEVVWCGWDQRKMRERVAKLKAMERQEGGVSAEEAHADALLERLATSHLTGGMQ